MEHHYATVVSHNREFQIQLKKNQAALTPLQAKLAKSESRRAELQQHLEEASFKHDFSTAATTTRVHRERDRGRLSQID
jgi:hypothetical protein